MKIFPFFIAFLILYLFFIYKYLKLQSKLKSADLGERDKIKSTLKLYKRLSFFALVVFFYIAYLIFRN